MDPTGTVDFITTSAPPGSAAAISSTTASTMAVSADPSAAGGVGTAMNTTWAWATASLLLL